ncbi:putative NAD/FAD-binding protein [Angulomicrobium tetraedrale]|uniref:Putative NAD/FAD-binding protein n=1 Tax=Ancylobacter tetraedralis TaxID=217068 RepID=A0A839Z5X4_9HYPH|nr:DUF2849 domain-containing protein [Ancylobacter tetraedralis]MBB3771072.1 putative NAD/FAD-binding protein [Ancylobacter tetraedralis]
MASPQQQKLKVNGPVAVTANRLTDGAVVWRTAQEDWSPDLADALIVTTADQAIALLASAQKRDTDAVGAYVAPVVIEADGAIAPGNLRERIRVAGPTFELPH